MFLSGSVDGTVSVWDYRSPHRQGVVHAAPSGASVFTCLDPPDAVCFAVAVDKMPTLALYDVRSFDKVHKDYTLIN
jgi:WD40 repeat protein